MSRLCDQLGNPISFEWKSCLRKEINELKLLPKEDAKSPWRFPFYYSTFAHFGNVALADVSNTIPLPVLFSDNLIQQLREDVIFEERTPTGYSPKTFITLRHAVANEIGPSGWGMTFVHDLYELPRSVKGVTHHRTVMSMMFENAYGCSKDPIIQPGTKALMQSTDQYDAYADTADAVFIDSEAPDVWIMTKDSRHSIRFTKWMTSDVNENVLHLPHLWEEIVLVAGHLWQQPIKAPWRNPGII